MALKTCFEYIRGLRYKLRILGISFSQPTFIYGDNQAVVKKSLNPELILKNKIHSVSYRFVREVVSINEWLVAYVRSEHKFSDTLTKTVPTRYKRRKLVSYYF